MKSAIYPGSFDPPTLGHFSIIQKAACMFDRLVVLVAINPDKAAFLQPNERVELLLAELRTLNHVSVDACYGLVADYASKHEIRYLVRGIRSGDDVEYEMKLARHNSALSPDLQTLLLPADEGSQFVSSTLLRLAVKANEVLDQLTSIAVTSRLQRVQKHYHPIYHRWISLGIRLDVEFKAWEQSFVGLVRSYQTSGRYYHNLGHIEDCLHDLDEVEFQDESGLSAIELAIWYHDVVYCTWRKDNEIRSARRAARELIRAGVSNEIVADVEQLVLTTREHNPDPNNKDSQLFSDIDVAILSRSEQAYRKYASDIRKEYGWVAERKYRAKRCLVLKQLMDRPRIYASDHFRSREQKARFNIQQELFRLDG